MLILLTIEDYSAALNGGNGEVKKESFELFSLDLALELISKRTTFLISRLDILKKISLLNDYVMIDDISGAMIKVRLSGGKI